MTSEVRIWTNTKFMENENEIESLRTRLGEIEDENQDLRAQNFLQKRTILEMRDEILLLRLRMSQMSDSMSERVRRFGQNSQDNDDTGVGEITVPPLMAPPPIPPPLPPTRVRISPRQVGAGEALTTPLGVSLSSPPRHRIKRDTRQGFYRSVRNPYRRFDISEPGPSSTTTSTRTTPTPTPTSTSTFIVTERPNYLVGLRIIPQFQTSFVCSPTRSSGYSDSASDSSGSDEITPIFKTKVRPKTIEGESSLKKPPPFQLFKTVRDFQHPKVRETLLQNYDLSPPNTNSKIFFPVSWNWKNTEGRTTTATGGNESSSNTSTGNAQESFSSGARNGTRISDCAQYTFPTIHEGLHHQGIQSAVTATGRVPRLRKFKKNIPYSQMRLSDEVKTEAETEEEKEKSVNTRNEEMSSMVLESESSISSTDEGIRLTPVVFMREMTSDVEQDGFQGDESSNCLTSTDNSLEKICISDSNVKK